MDFNKMMAQAKKMQAEIDKREREFENKIFSFEKQGIKMEINGALKITSLDINEALIDPEDKEILQDLIIVTANEAFDEIIKDKNAIKTKATQGIF